MHIKEYYVFLDNWLLSSLMSFFTFNNFPCMTKFTTNKKNNFPYFEVCFAWN